MTDPHKRRVRSIAFHIQRLADIIEECQPKTPYVIAATALAQAILSHPDIGLVLGNSDGPAVLEGREPAFVAGEPSDEEFRQLYCDIFDLRCDPASLGPVPVKFARAVLARWGHQPARLRNCPTHGQQPPEAWGCPECVRELREELADERMRLSACFKIAICDTPETAIRARYEYRKHYWSPAAEAIAQKIDELIRLRKRFSEEAESCRRIAD